MLWLMPMEFYKGRPLEPDELEAIRLQIEQNRMRYRELCGRPSALSISTQERRPFSACRRFELRQQSFIRGPSPQFPRGRFANIFAGSFEKGNVYRLDRTVAPGSIAPAHLVAACAILLYAGSSCRLQDRPGGQGETIAIARGFETCPVRALRSWLDAAGIASGPIFRPINKAGVIATARLTDQLVTNVVKTYAERCGLDPNLFAGHSLDLAS